jgi:hypothetical protein
MADQEINIPIRTKGAKKAKNELKGLSNSISSLGRSALNAGAAYFGTRGLIQGLMESTRLAGVQEQAEKSLEVALGRTSKALLNQASALEQVTTFGDEATIQQQAFLASLGFSEDKIMDIIPVAMDLATATGMTLESAVRNTAKTFSGLAGELGEMVPQLRDLTAEEMKAGDAVKIMADLFGGQAQAQTKTYAGSVKQLKNQLGSMGEQIGRIVIPVFEELAPHLRTAINFWSKYLDVGSKTETQTTKYSKQLKDLTDKITHQRTILKGLTKDNLFANRETKEGSLLLKRARISRMEVTEQYLHDKKVLGDLITQKYNLKKVEEELLDVPPPPPPPDLSTPFKDFLENQAPALEAGYDQFVNTLIDTDMHGKERREQVWSATKSSFIKFTGELIKEKIKQGAMEEALDKASIIKAAASNAAKNAIQASGAVTGYIRSLFQTMPWFAALPMAAAGGVAILSLIKKQTSSIASDGLTPFADGGIVQGDPSRGDSVPAILTPGEIILNASQQQGLLNSMGGVTVNIQGNMIGNEEFVRDTLIPEIDRTVNRGLA